jgi:hypothetical protein
MSDEIRRVHRARLRTGDAALVAPGRALLEDALHVATVPGAQGSRLTLIRRLELGAIDVARSSASLALRIEARMRDAVAHAVPGESDAAARSDAVYFVDPVHPMVALALRIAQGAAADEWFWRDAVPGWRPGTPQPAALREIVAALARREEALPALARLVEALAARGADEALLRALRIEDGALLLRVLGAPREEQPEVTASHTHAGVAGAAIPTAFHALLARAARNWGADDARSLALCAIALAAERGSASLRIRDWRAARTAMQTIARGAGASSLGAQPPRGEPTRAAPASPERAFPEPASTTTTPRPSSGHGALDSVSELDARDALPRLPRAVRRTRAGQHEGPEPPPASHRWSVPGLPTRVGGLLFALSALERIGLSDWLAAHAECLDPAWPVQLLGVLACDLGAKPDDGLLACLRRHAHGCPPVERFVAPLRWLDGIAAPGRLRIHAPRAGERVATDATGRLPLAAWTPPAQAALHEIAALRGARRGRAAPRYAADAMRAWRTALRRWLRRYAGVGLASLVRRPARIDATATHLDLYFDLPSADVRIRRAGLDLDPGWVSWLGRVVSFHYLPADEHA